MYIFQEFKLVYASHFWRALSGGEVLDRNVTWLCAEPWHSVTNNVTFLPASRSLCKCHADPPVHTGASVHAQIKSSISDGHMLRHDHWRWWRKKPKNSVFVTLSRSQHYNRVHLWRHKVVMLTCHPMNCVMNLLMQRRTCISDDESSYHQRNAWK